ncbi:uncharacterized protein LOC116346974 [Contarinia nasturtii]|uniref:uncharacterized protein LOC116346974 n=1 Tax=Contarinia nasturtii TaxID=265458 RepID=UPI0012D3836C|nr:uncharacterized protein LOC116346974 [Contarinia nasturtii]XP_031633172.1 uncharacterized protein LOC116346974 [Contarinia nasturtii]XP_031633173.1 uncharacterized protein LOC116346974 [Contarinia nasturtii]XP_031633174.1 uncharacterized protein LOC116346974 [Contarinia nasturtii]XP_031633175.1 uncharacterized protein LOC116346974 [Contarinia nasturtii]XP_031633176.1 uncharacterized protein LOC116346974 [Contarinia nasturtii]XP_031633177.1 uncharacterized protein LOC116346974 [Contarinia n
MHQLNIIIVVWMVLFYMSNGENVPIEDTTDTVVDVYDPMGSDETFDPQKDYIDIKSSYAKFYKLSGPPIMVPPASQQKSWQLVDETTNPDNYDDTNDMTSTIPPQIEQQTTIKFTENTVKRTMNDIVKNTPQPNTFDTYEQSIAPNAEHFMQKTSLPSSSFELTSINGDNRSEDDFVNETGNDAQPAPFVSTQNDTNIHNESGDYINDEAIETNYSQPITSIPYSMDTTITSLPSSPVFISTRPPTPFSTSTSTSTITAAAAVISPPLALVPAPLAPSPNGRPITPIPQVNKRPKKIKEDKDDEEKEVPRIYKYSADEIVRKYLDDTFLRAPLATLINTAPEPLRKAKMLWKSALRPNTPIDIVLVAFNSSGVGVTYSFKNTRTMIAGLDSVQESREMIEGGSGFYGILRASELVPYDSAIFISTDKIPQDLSLMKNAATILLKKRIRLYLIWFGDQVIEENETSIGGALGEVALRSGGEILRITEESFGNGDMGLVTHFLQNDIQGAQILEIPVNTTDTNLHIKIQGNVDQATIMAPTDGKICNLLSIDSVKRFSNGSRAIYMPNDQKFVIDLNITATPKGIYVLTIVPEITNSGTYEKYNLMVDSEFDRRTTKNEIDTTMEYFSPNDGLMFRNRRSETLSEARDDEVVWPEYQNDNQFDEPQFITNDTEILTRSEKSLLQSVTKIDLGAQSQLLANPGSTVQIYYEITNLRDVPTLHNFQVTDEQRFLRTLNPVSMWLAPGQTNNAIVTCFIPANIEVGTKDKITFTSPGQNLASQSAILTVTSPQSPIQDRYAPYVYWKYGSRCYGRSEAGHCAGSIWSVEITTYDTDTGILRVQSSPKGLLIRDRYTAGTTEEVKATYTASCCTPRVTITSYDVAGNPKTITLDVTDFYLEPMEIVAIVLGSILLLIIIVAIILGIIYCCKKHRNTRELPVYRSRAERDRST